MNLKKTLNNINKSKENFFNLKGNSWINLDILKKNLLSNYALHLNMIDNILKTCKIDSCTTNNTSYLSWIYITLNVSELTFSLFILNNKIPKNIITNKQLFLVS
jgi:hypothetical protein